MCACFLALLTLIWVLFLGGVLFLKNREIKKYSGTVIHTHARYGKIDIFRDSYGIPHINASQPYGIYYGSGYAQAQDRLFQMDTKRKMGQGRLSEFAGNQTIEMDLFFRSLNLQRMAQAYAEKASDHVRTALQAFADGINDYVRSLRVMPIDYYLFGMGFEEWVISDSYLMVEVSAACMIMDYQLEPLRTKIAEVFGFDFAAEVLPARKENMFKEVVMINDEELKQMGLYESSSLNGFDQFLKHNKITHFNSTRNMIKLMNNLKFLHEYGGGSNAWAISGNFTKSGKPILGSDPHLSHNIPHFWYQMELIYKDKYAIGFAIPGVPSVAIGRNNYYSQGFTLINSDVADFYEETIQNGKYLYDGQYIDLKTRTEVFKIKGCDPLVQEIQYTHHGPLLDKSLSFVGRSKVVYSGKVTSVVWTGFHDMDSTMHAYINSIDIRSIEQLKAMKLSTMSWQLNSLIITRDNHIGAFGLGTFPIRRNQYMGAFIKNGSDPQNDWLGYIPNHQKMHVIDPHKGYVISANNKFASDNYVYQFSVTQTYNTGRISRIESIVEKKLQSGEKFTEQDMMAMQLDTQDYFAVLIIPKMVQLYKQYGAEFLTEQQRTKYDEWMGLLSKWDGDVRKESQEALIYNIWEMKFADSLFQLQFTQAEHDQVVYNLQFDHFTLRYLTMWAEGTKSTQQEWCKTDANQHVTQNNCMHNLMQSLVDTESTIIQKCGTDRSNWKWGNIRHKTLKHTIFGQHPLLKLLFNRKHSDAGNRRTINLSAYAPINDDFDSYMSSGARIVINQDENEKSYWILDTGASESLFSSHYDDQLALFKNGTYIEMKQGEKHFHEYTTVLRLRYESEGQDPIPIEKERNDL